MNECKHFWIKSQRIEGGGRCAYDEGDTVTCYRCVKCNKTISTEEYKDAEITRLTKELDEARALIPVRRICSSCGKPIGKHHKFYIADGKPIHRCCQQPTAYAYIK